MTTLADLDMKAFICPRCARANWHPLEIYFRWCAQCRAVTGTPRPCPHGAQNTTVTPWLTVRDNQDDCMIAIENKKPLPTKALRALPPWRAVMLARVANAAGIPLQDGTLEQIEAEARAVTGSGQLGEWWLKEVPA